MSAYTRYKVMAEAMQRQRDERNEADAHWHADMYMYWMRQATPPADPRWLDVWRSTHNEE